jgi:shikimate dehydrogenase
MHMDGTTALIGIIANPIAQVRTPQLFNESAGRQGLNVACVPFHVMNDDLVRVMRGIPGLHNLLGLIVTIPYKERVLEFCAELTETAQLVGSANALRIDRTAGVIVGGNFDGDGFVAGLRERGHSLCGKRVLLIGAGGAGKSIAYAVARELPGELVIHNRSPQRALSLVERLQPLLPHVAMRGGGNDPAGYDVVINATSLGLSDADALPLPAERLSSGTLVCEAVVREWDTPLLAAARQRSCMVHHGQYMLYGQIVEISRFLGIDMKEESVARIPGPREPSPAGLG